MHQVVQEVRSGKTTIRSIPAPLALPGKLLVGNVASLISAGTERSIIELSRLSLVGKARARPDQVRRILEKAREEGLLATVRQVNAKLDEPMPLGYSSAGIVLECGPGVTEFKPGDRVACAAPHAGIVSVGRNLCAVVPPSVSFEQACYSSVAAIALEGVRLTRTGIGDRVLVIGLGLVGQISVALLKAQGCHVFGTDVQAGRLDLAQELGADAVGLGSPAEAVSGFTHGIGVDAVLITAATTSNEPIEFAARVSRVRGRIVLVGVVGLNLPRTPFFEKELEFTVSSSLGPGRGDPAYEEQGIDYPPGHVRWTAKRNMEAVLDTMAAGSLPVEKLTTHRFSIEEAAKAYDLIADRRESYLGVVLGYPQPASVARHVAFSAPAATTGAIGVGVIGAGNYARLTLLPLLAGKRGTVLSGLCSEHGLHAEDAGRRSGFAFATSDPEALFSDSGTRAVFVATRHDSHARLIVDALRAGKHVFVEKPLCLSAEELLEISACVDDLGDRCPILMVGFNRRFARASAILRSVFGDRRPLTIDYRFAVPPLPANHWTQLETVGGGRIIGEACHAIDLCVALTESTPVRVFAESATGGDATTDDRVFITMRHADGSVSSVRYDAGGDAAFAGERIEVVGGGRAATVERWNRIEVWDAGRRTTKQGGKDRGHDAAIDAFLGAVRSGGPWPIPWEQLQGGALAGIAAVQSIREGRPIELDATEL